MIGALNPLHGFAHHGQILWPHWGFLKRHRLVSRDIAGTKDAITSMKIGEADHFPGWVFFFFFFLFQLPPGLFTMACPCSERVVVAQPSQVEQVVKDEMRVR